MCYSIAYLERKAEKLIERYKHVLPHQYRPIQISAELDEYFFVSGFSHPILPVITSNGIALMQWGLIPYFCKDLNSAKEMQSKTLNAVGETITEKKSFSKLLSANRCIVPISGFFEWQHKGQNKIPFFIKSANNDLLSAAGLFSIWNNPLSGENIYSFSIITTAANKMMEEIHNTKKRMPVFLKPDDEWKWLNNESETETLLSLLKPADENFLTAYTISNLVNKPKENRNKKEVLEPFDYGGDLFG